MTAPRVEGERVEMDPPVCVCGDHFTDDALCYACRRDTERSLQEAELRLSTLTAEVERLREALVKVRAHTAHTKASPDALHIELLASIERIANAALALPTPAPEGQRDG